MRANNFIILALLAISPASHAAKHHIDSYLESCIDADSTTAGMVNCTNQAYSLWDKELNIKYNNLMSALAPADKQALRNAQRQWVAFRDAEFEAIDALYNGKDGTMYLPMRAADRLEIIKNRVLQLTDYTNLIID